jgi:hypothetical protein
MVKVDKGDWDKSRGPELNHEFNTEWLKRCQRALKPNGTIWVTGTSHVIFSVGYAMQQLGFKILNDIAWEKPNPPPNLSCRYFTHSTETVLWAAKNGRSKHQFNYALMRQIAGGKQMKSVWRIYSPKADEKKFGKHRRRNRWRSSNGASWLRPGKGFGARSLPWRRHDGGGGFADPAPVCWHRTGRGQSQNRLQTPRSGNASFPETEFRGGIMAGRAIAVANGDQLVRAVLDLGRALGLEAMEQVRVARRIWGAVRRIDVVLTHPQTRKTLGLECKYQGTLGTAEEKIPATIKDIEAWPIPGLVVFSGDGFTENMRSFLISTGKAVEFEELQPWLCLFFGLPSGHKAKRGFRRAKKANCFQISDFRFARPTFGFARPTCASVHFQSHVSNGA